MSGLAGGNSQDIGELLKKIVKGPEETENEIYSIVGKVKDIDGVERTVTVEPINGDADVLGVRLQASQDLNTGIVVFPKLNSFVVVTFLNRNTGFISLVSEVDNIVIQNDTESLKDILNDLIKQINLLTVTTAVGPSGTPINFLNFEAIDKRINKLFKQ